MNTADTLLHILGVAAVASPAVLLAILGLSALLGVSLSEAVISRLTQTAVMVGLVSTVAAVGLMLAAGRRYVAIDLGNWVAIPQQDFHFRLKFVLDRLSIPFTILSFVLCGVVGAFTTRYLHHEPGYRRFFLLYALFLIGMVVSAVAGTIETLFFGWEMVGLSSALLVAYFQERKNPVRNGQRIWVIYRLSDAAFLVAALMMHHVAGAGDFSQLVSQGPWPVGQAVISPHHALLVGLLLLVAAAGKSALVPFSGWLPRAMEGPTPSSAVFYGALSVHLGVYLLLRVSPILQVSWPLQVVVVVAGLMSAVFGSVMSRVQSDVKSSLAYASLTQVGIIVVEIGVGLHYIPLIHIIGHACLRTLQLLRAPNLLHDYHALENAVGSRLKHDVSAFPPVLPMGLRRWWYRFGFERGFMDILLDRWIVEPFLALFRWVDGVERRWTDWLSSEPSRDSDRADLHPESSGKAA